MRTWLSAVHTFAREHAVDRGVLGALQAYGRGGERPFAGDFCALEGPLDAVVVDLCRRIRQELVPEVDAHQAEMFAERFRSVDRLLAEEADAGSRVLRVGLVERLRQVLDEGGETRALRVRGVVDFFYSQAALHWHAREDGEAPALSEWASQVVFREVRHGVDRASLVGSTVRGPQHIQILRVQPGVADLDVVDAWKAWGPEQDLLARVDAAGALAAFSGGFFLYSEPDLCADCCRHDPVGLVMGEAGVASPAVFSRAALVQRVDGAFGIQVLGLGSHEVRLGDGSWGRPTAWVNRARAARADGVALVGERVVGVGADLPVPLNGVVLQAVDGRPVQASPGDRVAWRLPGVRAGVSGGPVLVRNGTIGFDLAVEEFAGTAPPRTFVDDETGDRNLLPRLAAGLTADGALLVAAVDGRNAERALGLGLHDLGEVMVALGAVHAMNLDGGSSKRLVVDGALADLPSIGVQGRGVQVAEVRPLHTAVLVRLR